MRRQPFPAAVTNPLHRLGHCLTFFAGQGRVWSLLPRRASVRLGRLLSGIQTMTGAVSAELDRLASFAWVVG